MQKLLLNTRDCATIKMIGYDVNEYRILIVQNDMVNVWKINGAVNQDKFNQIISNYINRRGRLENILESHFPDFLNQLKPIRENRMFFVNYGLVAEHHDWRQSASLTIRHLKDKLEEKRDPFGIKKLGMLSRHKHR